MVTHFDFLKHILKSLMQNFYIPILRVVIMFKIIIFHILAMTQDGSLINYKTLTTLNLN